MYLISIAILTFAGSSREALFHMSLHLAVVGAHACMFSSISIQ